MRDVIAWHSIAKPKTPIPRRDDVKGRENLKVRIILAGRTGIMCTECTKEYAYIVTCAKNMK